MFSCFPHYLTWLGTLSFELSVQTRTNMWTLCNLFFFFLTVIQFRGSFPPSNCHWDLRDFNLCQKKLEICILAVHENLKVFNSLALDNLRRISFKVCWWILSKQENEPGSNIYTDPLGTYITFILKLRIKCHNRWFTDSNKWCKCV